MYMSNKREKELKDELVLLCMELSHYNIFERYACIRTYERTLNQIVRGRIHEIKTELGI